MMQFLSSTTVKGTDMANKYHKLYRVNPEYEVHKVYSSGESVWMGTFPFRYIADDFVKMCKAIYLDVMFSITEVNK